MHLSKHKNSIMTKFLKQAFAGEVLEIYGETTMNEVTEKIKSLFEDESGKKSKCYIESHDLAI